MPAITHTYRFTGAGEDFGKRADGLFIPHAVENSPLRTTVADAINVARWQDRPDVAGSYNRIICSDGILSTVPDDHASGGVNPSSADFKPPAWLYQLVDADEINNPNYFGQNVAVMGSVAHYNSYGWPDWAINGFALCWIDETQRIGRKPVLVDHDLFQTNRSDVGPIARALIETRYAELIDQFPEDDTVTDFSKAIYQQPKIVRLRKGAPVYDDEFGQSKQGELVEDTDFFFPGITLGQMHLVRRDDKQGGAVWIYQEAIIPESEVPFQRYVLEDAAALAAATQTVADLKTSVGAKNLAIDHAIPVIKALAPIAEELTKARAA